MNYKPYQAFACCQLYLPEFQKIIRLSHLNPGEYLSIRITVRGCILQVISINIHHLSVNTYAPCSWVRFFIAALSRKLLSNVLCKYLALKIPSDLTSHYFHSTKQRPIPRHNETDWVINQSCPNCDEITMKCTAWREMLKVAQVLLEDDLPTAHRCYTYIWALKANLVNMKTCAGPYIRNSML